MSEAERASTKNARVPSDQLPKDAPHKYDAFLEPLVEDLIDLYIEDKEVFFKLGIDGYSPSNDTTLLCVVPLLLTVDLLLYSADSCSLVCRI